MSCDYDYGKLLGFYVCLSYKQKVVKNYWAMKSIVEHWFGIMGETNMNFNKWGMELVRLSRTAINKIISES